MENCSNCTSPNAFHSTGFLAFSITMLVAAVAAIFFNLLTAVVLSTRKEVIPTIRILLVNLLAGAVFTAIPVVMQNAESMILAASSNAMPVEAVCRVYVYFFRSSAAARLCHLAAYSIAVMRVVIKTKTSVKPVHTLPAIVTTWLYAMVISIQWTIPPVSMYTYVGDVRCLTQQSSSTFKLETALLALWIVMGGIIPTIICVSVIITAFCYIRKLTLSEVTLFKKGLVRLALFLFIANISNLINMIVPPILLHFDPNLTVTSYFITGVNNVMLWSTAFVIVMFIKPVRSKIVAILCCSQCKRQQSSRHSTKVQSSVSYKEVSLLDKSYDITDWAD